METTPSRYEIDQQPSPQSQDKIDNGEARLGKRVICELAILTRTSIPASLGFMLQNSMQTVSIAIVAHSNNDTSHGNSNSGDVALSASAQTVMLRGGQVG